MKRTVYGVIGSGLLILLLLAGTRVGTARPSVQARSLPPPFQSESQQPEALMLEFGIRDHESTPWGGSVAMQGGEILEFRGHHFTAEHRIDGHTWTAGSTSWPASHVNIR